MDENKYIKVINVTNPGLSLAYSLDLGWYVVGYSVIRYESNGIARMLFYIIIRIIYFLKQVDEHNLE